MYSRKSSMDAERVRAYIEALERRRIPDGALYPPDFSPTTSTADSIARKTMLDGIASKATSTATDPISDTASNLTMAQFAWKLLVLLFLQLTWPIRVVFSFVFDVSASTVHSYLWPTFRLFLWSAAIAFVLWVAIACLLDGPEWFEILGGMARDRYDEFALNNNILLSVEHGWANFKQASYDQYLRLRYNAITDRVKAAIRDLYFLPDNTMRLIRRNWRKAVLLSLLLSWALLARQVGPEVDRYQFVPMYRLAAKFGTQVPEWVFDYHLDRKSDGSNSHFRPEPETSPAVRYQDWAKPVAEDGTVSASVKPAVVTVTVTTVKTRSLHELPAETDASWPKVRTNVSRDMVYCKVCRQYHCNELPY
ncbi:hypothetical protein BAUCODRAFT_239358 [Baudoinia panamericana UAMH 10762]|uniref:Uncharacterized protein n=1 Tax=Baudoinia panamericana (strain UAMH 10762) TaxID=717646 RepID=M2N352_BAUPA|nr:uncharacterized protein BAUCODRAFT_239358 [Baudoinia panamericana UAMH 10762]EMC93409.1 hypothetical protein BAUCODRAFT_239358 [Baudoinia panamericana UAMH 10762]